MSQLRNIAVFCGSSLGNDPCYVKAAELLAKTFVEKSIRLIYGGASVGLMGVIADTVIVNGGLVIGVIPKALSDIELSHRGITELHIVNNMHERKALIAEFSDGFIMLPGGTGSLDEFFEIYTWAQLGIHQKPCGILNVNNYYDGILQFLGHSAKEGFLKMENLEMILVDSHIENLLEKLSNYKAPNVSKWITKEENLKAEA